MSLLVAVLACAQTPTIPEPYQSLVDLAHAAPPEFGADALLRLVESGKIADRDAQRDLVDQAFRLAIAAKFPVRKHPMPGANLDTREGSLAQAYGLKLDALSLQSRAVSDMIRVDAPAARRLLQEIPLPTLDRLSCDDALFYEVGDFYQAVSSVVNSAFTAQERAKDEHVNLLLGYIGQVSNPAQLIPLAQAIQAAGVTGDQREILWTKFNSIVQNLDSDDRSFSGLFVDPHPGTESILAALQGHRGACKYDAAAGQQGNAVAVGNTQPGAAPANAAVSTPKYERYWQSAEARRMFDDGRKLRYADGLRILTETERSTPEWQQQLTDYLSALGAWGPGAEGSEAAYYNEKCTVYIALVELIPRGPMRDKMLEAFFDFVGNSPLQQQSPVEWFNQANFMLERVRITRDGEPDKVQTAFEHTGSPILALQAALDKSLGVKQPAWLTGSP